MKKKPKAVKKPGNPSARWPLDLHLLVDRHLLMVAAAWFCLPNLGGFFIQQTVIKPTLQQSQQQLHQQIFDNTQKTLAMTLTALPDRLEKLSTDKTFIQTIIDSPDLKPIELQLSTLLPIGSEIRLLKNEQSLVTRDDYVLLNFFNQLKNGKKPPPQILKKNNQYLYRIGIELNADNTRQGFLIVSIPLDAVLSSLPKLAPNLGYLEIASPLSGIKMLSLYSSGNAEFKTAIATPEKITIAQLPLTVFLHLDSAVVIKPEATSLFWLWINSTSILSFIVWLVLRRQSQQQLKANFKNLLTHIQLNNTSREAHYSLPHFQHAEDQIKKLLLSIQPKTQAAVDDGSANAKSLFLKTANNITFTEDASFDEDFLLNLDLNPEDNAVFELTPTTTPSIQLPATVFRQYDIRGIVTDTLTPELVSAIGQALGTQSLKKMQSTIVIGRDGRHSSPTLSKALAEGIMKSGCNVLDIGEVPTPLVYFATHHTEFKSGVMITGSHNPPEYNGLKMVLAGETLFGQHILDLKALIETQKLTQGQGHYATQDLTEAYLQRATQDTVLARRLKVVVDAGNGVAGPTALALLDLLGCDVIPLYCDIDGDFPNHHPDPSKPENLVSLIKTVKAERADVGIAFDGDGDRLGVVTPAGHLIFPDRLLMYFARDILAQNPGGDIIFDVKCSSSLNRMISQWGGRPIMWKTGHSLIKAKLKETQALLAGEMSGHIFFNDRWFGFDDALYSAARLLELLSADSHTLDEAMREIPELVSTPEINIAVSEEEKFSIIEALKTSGRFSSGKVTTLDGIRVDYPNGWGLIRASNTTPVLVARFEAETLEEMQRIREEFAQNLAKVNPALKIPS